MWTLRQGGEGHVVVAPDERLAWPAMFGLGAQHVLAMFGSTAIVPVLIGFPVSTTLLFSGIGTLLFVLITGNRVPSYTGSSFAFIAPVLAAKADGRRPRRARRHPVRRRRARAGRPADRPRRLPRRRVPAAAGRHGRDRRADRPQPRAGGEGPVQPAGRDRAVHAGRDPARHGRPARPAAEAERLPRRRRRLRVRRDPGQGRLDGGPRRGLVRSARTSLRRPSTAARSC